jgi:hypothetical protein
MLALALALTLHVATAPTTPDALPYRLGDGVVAWDGDAASLADVAQRLRCTSRRFGVRPLYRITCPLAGSPAAQAALWKAWINAGARWVEPAYYETLSGDDTADDAGDASAAERCEEPPPTLDPALWHLAAAGAQASWRSRRGCEHILVAVIDTGIWAAHPSLSRALWRNPAEVCGNGVDDDANGFIDDCDGWDFGAQDPNPSPLTLPATKPDGARCLAHHATFMAGLIAATPPDEGAPLDPNDPLSGLWGVCGGKASLLNVKKHPDDTCLSTTADSAQALAYAVDAGADIALLAFLTDSPSLALDEALLDAAAHGVLTVIPAGNYADDADAHPRYPIHSPQSLSLVVAASDRADRLTAQSSWGRERVLAAAPGESLRSCALPVTSASLTWTASGTSYAAALAAGIAALTWAADPERAAQDVLDDMRLGATPTEALTCDPLQPDRPCVRWGARLSAPQQDPPPDALPRCDLTDTDTNADADAADTTNTTSATRADDPQGGSAGQHPDCACSPLARPLPSPRAPRWRALLSLLSLFTWAGLRARHATPP